MSSTKNDAESDDTMLCCASCGTAEVDNIKLKECTACKSVRYCGVKCQKEHRPKHRKDCKKRAAELRDEILFRNPESSDWGDCPICLLPMSLDPHKYFSYSCCCKVVCSGCVYANTMRELNEKLEPKCPFCREPWAKERSDKNLEWKKRADANDPLALRSVGKKFYDEGDYVAAFEYFTKAVASGDVESNRFLSFLYRDGNGVEKDKKKQVYHLEEGAIAGNHAARYDLGFVEFGDFKRTDRAVKHWIIAASNGQNEAMKVLKDGYRQGLVTKDDLLQVLRAYQAAIDATKSPQREEADAALQRIKPRLQQM